ncbi:MAG TPA: uroporphyrinogen-III synthase [Gemmatimonadales bacterium]|nr:uroporphyrinogen-III synthase [Gemmatimonadales bacterium]
MTPPTVVVTVSAGTLPGLVEALRRVPLPVEEHPLLSFAPPLDWRPLDGALDTVARYDAVALTSPRAARAFAERWQARGGGGASLPPVWAGGPGTVAALADVLSEVHSPSAKDVGERGSATALAAAMIQAGVRGPVLFPCGEIRREELTTRLQHEGIEVEEIVCYRSVLAGETAARAAAERAGILVVASPSVADLLARNCPPGARPALVAVGPTTAASARASGWAPDAVATRPTVEALVATVRSLIGQGLRE